MIFKCTKRVSSFVGRNAKINFRIKLLSFFSYLGHNLLLMNNLKDGLTLKMKKMCL